jgi:AAA+ superfamily predicted ATPase
MALVPTGKANSLPAPGGQPAPGEGVQITWAPELAERLRTGLPLTVLGQAALAPPLGRVLVLGRSDGGPSGATALAAVIMPDASPGALALAPFGLGPLAGAFQPPDELRERFPARRTGEAIFILDEQGRERFVVGPGVVLNHLVIACGAWPLVAPLFGPRTRARPVADAAALRADLDAFCHLVAATVNAIYRRQGSAPPSLAFTIRPTGLNVDAALGGLRWLGRSAADLITRLPKGTPFAPPLPQRAPVSEPGAGDPEAAFDEVGGLEEAKRELQAICLALRDPEAYRRWGARPPKGVLLFGPPGTGKTLLARCLAQAAGARFIHVRAADITSKWYGEAERRMQLVFDRARRETPAVLFFDEIDAIARDRDGSHEATHRVVSTLLENMDGLQELQGVVVVAATNRPEAVDPALLRPGRFDRLVEVPLPDREARGAIFRVHMGRAERQAGRSLFEPLDGAAWNRLLDVTEGFSGAEIAETVRRALEEKVRAGVMDGRITPAELLHQARTVRRQW